MAKLSSAMKMGRTAWGAAMSVIRFAEKHPEAARQVVHAAQQTHASAQQLVGAVKTARATKRNIPPDVLAKANAVVASSAAAGIAGGPSNVENVNAKQQGGNNRLVRASHLKDVGHHLETVGGMVQLAPGIGSVIGGAARVTGVTLKAVDQARMGEIRQATQTALSGVGNAAINAVPGFKQVNFVKEIATGSDFTGNAIERAASSITGAQDMKRPDGTPDLPPAVAKHRVSSAPDNHLAIPGSRTH